MIKLCFCQLAMTQMEDGCGEGCRLQSSSDDSGECGVAMVKVDRRWKWWRVICIIGLPQLQWWKMMGSSNDGGRRVLA